jgi:hypothetical protein
MPAHNASHCKFSTIGELSPGARLHRQQRLLLTSQTTTPIGRPYGSSGPSHATTRDRSPTGFARRRWSAAGPTSAPLDRHSSMAELADGVEAIDAVLVNDHLLIQNVPGIAEGEASMGAWDCWTMLAALAATTRRVQIASFVACALYRNPALSRRWPTRSMR